MLTIWSSSGPRGRVAELTGPGSVPTCLVPAQWFSSSPEPCGVVPQRKACHLEKGRKEWAKTTQYRLPGSYSHRVPDWRAALGGNSNMLLWCPLCSHCDKLCLYEGQCRRAPLWASRSCVLVSSLPLTVSQVTSPLSASISPSVKRGGKTGWSLISVPALEVCDPSVFPTASLCIAYKSWEGVENKSG